MYAYGDDGRQLDARYEVERDGGGLALILASASGASGSRPARNADYRSALLVFLQRLKELNGVIEDALVDSDETRRRGVPEDERRIVNAPIELGGLADVDSLRKELQYKQRFVGQTPGAKRDGNATRRIRLRLTVPGFGPEAAEHLANVLAFRPVVLGDDEHQLPDGLLPPSLLRFPQDSEERAVRAAFDAQDASDAPISDEDARKRTLRQIVARQGQSGFRNKLFIAYDGRCAVTRCDVIYVLEAAHLHPYRGLHTNVVTNGLLLRADIHTLLDYKLWAPDPATRVISVSKSLVDTPYGELSGKAISEPISPAYRPGTSVLERVWEEFRAAEGRR